MEEARCLPPRSWSDVTFLRWMRRHLRTPGALHDGPQLERLWTMAGRPPTEWQGVAVKSTSGFLAVPKKLVEGVLMEAAQKTGLEKAIREREPSIPSAGASRARR